jgi:Mrp family chromosome partitioning ATPase
MNRMLKALEQIEQTRQAMPRPPVEPVRGPEQMEQTLAAAERAVADDGSEKAEEETGKAEGGPGPGEGTTSCAMPEDRGEQPGGPAPQTPAAGRPPAQRLPQETPEPVGAALAVQDPDAVPSSLAAAVEVVAPVVVGASTASISKGEQWRRLVDEPVAKSPMPASPAALMDRSCVSPLLHPSIADRAAETPVAPQAAAAATAGPAAAPAASRPGVGKVVGQLKGELADMGRIILGQLGPTRPAAILLATADGEIQRGLSLLSLARTLGQQVEGDVVLVGCDWQSKGAAERYGITAERGLIDLLAGGGRGVKAVQRVGNPPVSVLLGRGYASPAQATKDLSWKSLVQQLKQRYRLAILDATGLACAQAAAIARHCDGTYLLVIAGETPRRAAARAVGILSRADARLLGCVLVTG